ncbi:MAG TPA: PilZ domain-containing protein [Polyangia bacterium]
MSLGLSAPAAVPVELRAADRRVFRLSDEIGMGGIRLRRAAPFEPGRPVSVRFALPGSTSEIALDAEVVEIGDESEAGEGGAALYFIDPSPEVKSAIAGYVAERLGIPQLS